MYGFMLYIFNTYFKHPNGHFRWLPWQQKIVTHQTYFIQYIVVISIYLENKNNALINIFLKFMAVLPFLPPFTDLMVAILLVTIATVHPILLKPFLSKLLDPKTYILA